MRITDALDEYIEQLKANGRSPHTVAQAKRHVLALARWTDEDLEGLTHQHIARFLVEHQGKRCATTLNALRSSIRCFFRHCESAGYVETNAARLVQRARCTPPLPRALSEAEQERLVHGLEQAATWPEKRDRALFLTMLGTGIRLGSALALRVDDVDLDAGVIEIRAKGNVRSRLPISAEVRALLADWMEHDGPVFPSRSGAPLSSRQAQARFRSWCRRAGIRAASPHTLRHSFAMRLLRRTRDLSIVQRALAHRSIMSTVVYAQADDEAVRAALAV